MVKKITTIEQLAVMVQKGFEETATKQDINRLDIRIDRVEQEIMHLRASVATIERDTAEIRRNSVYRQEFDDLMSRVKYLEKKIGIESGK